MLPVRATDPIPPHPSPRAEALGAAASVVLEDAFATAFTPAGLAFLPQPVVQTSAALEGGSRGDLAVAVGAPLSRRSTLGVTASYREDVERLTSLTYARLEKEDFAFGFGVTIVRPESVERERWEGIAGFRKNSALSGMNLSFTVDHIGNTNRRPMEARVGLSTARLFGAFTYVTFSTEFFWREGGDAGPRAGVEVWGGNIGALRFGFDGDRGGSVSALSAGFGLHYKGWALDFAYRPGDSDPPGGERERYLLGISRYFGAPRPGRGAVGSPR